MGTQYELLKYEYEQLLEEKEQLEKKVSQLEEEVEDLEQEKDDWEDDYDNLLKENSDLEETNDDLEDKLGDYEDDAHSWQQLEDLFEGMDLNNLDTRMKIESFVQHCIDMPSWKFDQVILFYKIVIDRTKMVDKIIKKDHPNPGFSIKVRKNESR